MLAAVFEGEGRLELREVPPPTVVAPDDVVIEVEACGICGSDLHVLEVPPGHPATPGTIMGHEFVGVVVATGPQATNVQVGDRVVADPDPKCGSCVSCRAGRPGDCTEINPLGVHRHGALARFTTVPASALFPIARHVRPDVAALAEPLACVLSGVNRAIPRPGDSAVLFGAGPIGCLFVALLRLAGVDPVIVVEPMVSRHPVAVALGATEVVSPDSLEGTLEQTLPQGASIVVDAVGSVLPQAIEIAAMGGRIVLFGMNDNAKAPIPQVEITKRGLTILGTYITNFTFPAAIKLIESGRMPLEELITARYPLDKALDGFDQLRAGAAGKIVIRP